MRDIQNFMESNIETTIREYSAEADRPLTSNRDMIVPSYSHKLIDGIHICQEVLFVSKLVSHGATVKKYSSRRE